MNARIFARRSLLHYWRTNLATAIGIAAAVAVLAGAIIVGDSVRASLRRLVDVHLGRTNFVVASGSFFREDLASGWGIPLIALDATITHEQSGRRAFHVMLYGVDDRFFRLHQRAVDAPRNREVLLSDSLDRELGGRAGDELLIRIPKPSAIPAESLHGRKDNIGRTIRGTFKTTLSADAMGEFSLRPQQGSVRAVFVPLARLQRDLELERRANTVLASGPDPTTIVRQRTTLADIGLKIRPLDPQRGFNLEADGMILGDATVKAALAAASSSGLTARPIFSYLANSIRTPAAAIPYSLVAAIDIPQLQSDDQIVLNDWAAKELKPKPGDAVSFDYYLWDPAGRLVTRTATFRYTGMLPMEGIAADRDLSPTYPGISDTEHLSDWDPPFPVDLKRVRRVDEEYWDKYKTTPKAFIRLPAGQRLWNSRFGNVTSIRLCCGDPQAFATAFRSAIDPLQAGLIVQNVRAQQLDASSGATDFGEYFLYFSFFLVVSALLLAGLFFRFGIEQRISEIGLLRAVGFDSSAIRRLMLKQAVAVAVIGSLIGILGAFAYGALILYGLRTWWAGAVGTDQLQLRIRPGAISTALYSAMLLALVVAAITLRSLRRRTPRALLTGVQELPELRQSRRTLWFGIAAIVIAVLLLVTIPGAGGFFGAGTSFLIAALCLIRWRLNFAGGGIHTVGGLGLRYSSYRPGRSVLCIALIASAVFLIVSVDSFQKTGANNEAAGGYPFMAESSLPVIFDPNSREGKEELNLSTDARFVSLRLRPGEDASCLNLYQPRNPRVAGVPIQTLTQAHFRFAAGSWSDLAQAVKDGAIPAAADANSLTYVLHKAIGDVITIGEDTGRPVRLRFVASLQDSAFQSEVLVSEENFQRAFPEEQGYRMFLIQANAEAAGKLESQLSDYGFDVIATADRVAGYHRVENTYLATFRSLGALGLLLGTVGLGAVLLRNVLERRRELALLRAIGYRPEHLQRLVLAENAFLLLAGVGIGAVCSAIAVAPAWLTRGGQIPIISVLSLLAMVVAVGLLASWLAARSVARSPLLAALRGE